MLVYRVVKSKKRTNDLSGTGAYQFGGRWNNKGTYMLYTSSNSSLAMLETLVHYDLSEIPPHLFLMQLKIEDGAPIYEPGAEAYSKGWKSTEFTGNKNLGDSWMEAGKFLGVRVKSVVNELEFNYLLNPLFKGFHDMVSIEDVAEIEVDDRLR